jgi:hypothetical protein
MAKDFTGWETELIFYFDHPFPNPRVIIIASLGVEVIELPKFILLIFEIELAMTFPSHMILYSGFGASFLMTEKTFVEDGYQSVEIVKE